MRKGPADCWPFPLYPFAFDFVIFFPFLELFREKKWQTKLCHPRILVWVVVGLESRHLPVHDRLLVPGEFPGNLRV